MEEKDLESIRSTDENETAAGRTAETEEKTEIAEAAETVQETVKAEAVTGTEQESLNEVAATKTEAAGDAEPVEGAGPDDGKPASEEKPKKKLGKQIARIIFLLLGNAALIAGIWQEILFKGVSVASMIFQLMVPMEGADGGNFASLNIAMAIGLPVLTVLEVLIGNFWRKKTKRLKFFRERKVLCAAMWFVLIAVIMLAKLKVFSYLWLELRPSSIYEDRCVKAESSLVKAPEKKRNLIYIIMESMELSYMDKAHGGLVDVNRAPYLTQLALEEGDCFSGGNKLNGMMPVEGTTWTCGSLVSQTLGIPLIVPIGGNNMGNGFKEFLPGAGSIGQILRDNDYNLIFMEGSMVEFAGTDNFLRDHGNYTVRDYNYYNVNHRLPVDNYYVWWGFEDFRLYEFAKEELTEAAKGDQPFALTMMTIDTHFTGGYTCPLCPKDFKNSYDDAIRCADNQIRDFLAWVKQQDFYENTTIVIVGDHPTMDSLYYKTLSKKNRNYQRKAYAVILNSAVPYTLGKARQYCAFDMLPTTLAAMGFEIEGNRLGLGSNLYSDEKTMLEIYGFRQLNVELLKHSKYYNNNIIRKGN